MKLRTYSRYVKFVEQKQAFDCEAERERESDVTVRDGAHSLTDAAAL